MGLSQNYMARLQGWWILTRSATPSIALLHRQIHRQKSVPVSQIPSFHRTLSASSRLGRKEYRAGSMRSGVALRVRIQALPTKEAKYFCRPAQLGSISLLFDTNSSDWNRFLGVSHHCHSV